MRRAILSLLLLLALIYARGGGGCFLAGTLVSTPEGPVPIETLAVGDEVLSSDGGAVAISRVSELYSVSRDHYLSILTPLAQVNVTDEHPFDVGGGRFVEAQDLSAGDTVYMLEGASLAPEPVGSVTRVDSEAVAYNLRVDGPHTYFANNYSVHNKGGCFLAGTMVSTPGGSVPIETLAAGDEVLSPEGGAVTASRVLELFSVERDYYYTITASSGEVNVTAEHPFDAGSGRFIEAEMLEPGETVYMQKGGSLVPSAIISKTRVDAHVTAYNLRVDGPHTYFANNFSVHNKGGCFPAGTLISCGAEGCEKPIGLIVPGDTVLSFNGDGSLAETAVEDVYSLEADEYYTITAGSGSVNVTAEHPFLSDGSFVNAEDLHAGDFIYMRNGSSLSRERILSKVLVRSPMTVYNLDVGGPNTFFANGYAVHNKGGCFLPGTLVTRADGAGIPIEDVRPGDPLLSFDGSAVVESEALELVRVERGYYLSIATENGRSVNVTAEHPFYAGNGEFVEASGLRAGGRVYVLEGGALKEERISGIRAIYGPAIAYNLRVSGPSTFFANGFAVHNKGGSSGGSSHSSPPDNTFYYNCSMSYNDSGQIKACCRTANSVYSTAGKGISAAPYAYCRCTYANKTVVENASTYVSGASACECAASREELDKRGTLPSCPMSAIEIVTALFCVVAPFSLIVLVFLVAFLGQLAGMLKLMTLVGGKGFAANGEWSSTIAIPKSMVTAKSRKIAALLSQWGRADPAWKAERLKTDAEATFRKLQECWEKRDYSEMKPLMTENLYLQHVAQLEAMKARHEINRMGNLKVLGVEIVLVNNFHDKAKDNFVAWINASARDTIVDDRTGSKIRGDEGDGVFEEFWAFQRSGESWLLDRIDQPEEGMDIINRENFDSLLPKSSLERRYEKAGGPAIKDIGATATREREEATVGLGMGGIKEKAGRVSRLLNFLAESDKAWDETKMRTHVRALFITFNVCLELGDLGSVRESLSPALFEQCQKELGGLAQKKQKIQKRNLALRNAEIVLVKNYYDNHKDEFTAWLSGQSQTVIVDKDGEFVSGDSHVADFEEYWTFRRDGARWRLVSIEQGYRKYVEEENFDEGTGKQMLDWYYKQDRA